MTASKKRPSATIGEMFRKQGPMRVQPDDSLVMPFLPIGVEVEVERWNGHAPDGKYLWQQHNDDSLRNGGREFVLGPVCGQQVTDGLRALFATAKEQGWEANARTGIHIHVDASVKGVLFPYYFTSVYLMVEHALYGYAGEWRRWCNFCHSFEDAEESLLSLRKMLLCTDQKSYIKAANDMHRYAGLNFNSLAKHGTMEVRILCTSFDYQYVLNWINFIMSIYKLAEELESKEQNIVDVYKDLGPDRMVRRIFSRDDVYAAIEPHVKAAEVRRGLLRAKLIDVVDEARVLQDIDAAAGGGKKKPDDIVQSKAYAGDMPVAKYFLQFVNTESGDAADLPLVKKFLDNRAKAKEATL